jgi:ribosome-binding protein aMBF1 (putative translation factor)
MRKRSTELQELGRRIRSARTVLGFSQEELAYESDIDRSYLGGVERGERNITFKVLSTGVNLVHCAQRFQL